MQNDALFTKYWEKYADPLARAAAWEGPEIFSSAVVIPAKRETWDFIQRLFDSHGGDGTRWLRLIIVVINEQITAGPEVRESNARLIREISERSLESSMEPSLSRLHRFTQAPGLRILCVNLCRPGTRLREKEGVGRARKIGADIALHLYMKGSLLGRFVGSTDCDVELPQDYFDTLEDLARTEVRASALLFPYEHVGEVKDGNVARVMCELEASFRYYVLGLAQAGSPYAYHSLGSALAVSLPHYAGVRGFPNRSAGEDFYLLGKLAKLAPLRRLAGPRIRIQTRASDRVPFGTGIALQRALEDSIHGESFKIYHPESFRSLGRVVSALRDAALSLTPSEHLSHEGLSVFERRVLTDTWSSILPHLAHCPSANHRLRRVHETFDPLCCLRFIHACEREGGFPRLPVGEALRDLFHFSSELDIFETLQLLRQKEEALPEYLGPTLVG